MTRQTLGKRGEDSAADFLRNTGYEIITRNFYTRWGELDIIARDGEEIVFVEVKTRSSTSFARPEEGVDLRKQDHLRKAAEFWLSVNYEFSPPPCRFDVIAIVMKGREPVIEHIRDAFR